jgi:hypothetical protein
VTRNGGQISYTINITRSAGNSSPINLSVSLSPPQGAGFETITPNPVTGNSATLSFVVFATTAPGTYTFTVTGIDNSTGLIRTTTGRYKKG